MKILLTAFFLTLSVSAAELYQPGLQTRCLGMGGTCVSHVNGAEAVFFNPAALARVEGFDLVVAQAQVGISKDTIDFSSQFQGGTFSATDINSLYGKTLAADLTARAMFAVPNFGFGLYSNNYTNMTFSDPTFPTFNMNFISDYGYAVGGAISLGPDTAVGATIRHIQRWGGNQDISMASLAGSSSSSLSSNNFQDRGVGHALDLGIITTLNNTSLKPTLSLVWLDAGVTTFNMTSGTKNPPAQYDNLIFGASMHQELGFLKFTHAFEYKFIRTYNEDAAKKIHLGTELSLGLIDLRAGLNQGYVTYGAAVDLWLLEFEAAAYATELGTYAGQDRSDRYTASISIHFDFDQSFKIRDTEGKRRRLKQRR